MLRVYNKDSIVYKGKQVEKAKDNVVSFVFSLALGISTLTGRNQNGR